MADSIPFWDHGMTYTCHAAAAVVGGRFVVYDGTPAVDGNPAVRPCGAGEPAIGVAARDAVAGAKVMVHRAESIVAAVEAGAALAAGAKVQSDATGRAIPQAGAAPNAAVGTAVYDIAVGVLGPIDRQAR